MSPPRLRAGMIVEEAEEVKEAFCEDRAFSFEDTLEN
jgi:hypothetical protein